MSTLDVFREAMRAAWPALDYLAPAWARVVYQNADGSVDLTLERDPEAAAADDGAEIVGATIVHGLPGVRVEVDRGARVLVWYERGKAHRALVGLWETDAALVRIRFAGGASPLNRAGDPVDAGTLTIGSIPPPAPPGLVITYQPPGGAPTVITLSGSISVTPNPAVVALRGVTEGGNAKLIG